MDGISSFLLTTRQRCVHAMPQAVCIRVFAIAVCCFWTSGLFAQDIKLPPRTVDDIIKVLDKAAAYDQEFLEAKQWAAKTPPEGASAEALNTFYITRSEAFAGKPAALKLGSVVQALPVTMPASPAKPSRQRRSSMPCAKAMPRPCKALNAT